MTLADKVKEDLATAMRAGERDRVGRLRLVLSELQKAAKEGDDDEVAVLRRERKRRLDAAAQYREAGRDDLMSGEEAEAELIAGYLPAELPDSELNALVAEAVAEAGASSPRDMGAVMKLVMPRVGGRADGRRVSAAVKEILT
ncbi:MAG TPA: GatB/YqeY domain-containing protein [Solirubrobacteraceae bacterium]|nr:GatB/YqeY domain-containing protein [Solirubrobacteraceae bacterium]